MSKTDHLARAKDYIAKGEEYYRKAGEEILAAQAEGWTDSAIARELGRSRHWVRVLVDAASKCPRADEPLGLDWQSGSNKRDDVTRATLSNADEQTVEEIVAQLPPKAVERIAEKATDRLVQNARARRAEHKTEPTVDELTGGERFDPAEYWADTLIIHLDRKARELASLIQRAGGLLYGSMSPDEAFEYLHHAEGLIAEARAAAQEQVRDEVQV